MRLYNTKLVLETEVISNAYIIINDGKIVDFGVSDNNEGIDLEGSIVMPGFIDGHIHGAIGYDFMDESFESIEKIVSYLPSEGVTSILATTMTDSMQTLRNVVEMINSYERQDGETKVLGVHLEGPFISSEKVGAQNSADILELSVHSFEQIRNNTDIIKVVTFAPENDSNLEFTKHLASLGVKGSIGHSNATVACCNKSFENGVNRITHLYNAMSGLHHRSPGVVAGAFLNDMLCEMIVDKIHVKEEVVDMTFKLIGASRIALITDSMEAKGLGDGRFNLGGQEVNVKNGEARLSNGSLAGSTLSYIDGVKNFSQITSCTLMELSKVSSINQSKNLGVMTGQIKKGYQADLVVLDNNFNVVKTIIDGVVVFERS